MGTISKAFTPVFGKRIRVTSLTPAGVVPTTAAPDAFVVTDGFVTVQLTSEIEAGDEVVQKTSSGALCVNEKQASSFKRFTVEITFCGVNPYLLTMVSGAQPYFDANGDVAGFAQPEGQTQKYFALELWTGISGDKSSSGYLVLPFVCGGVLSDLKIDGKDAIDFVIKEAYTEGGNQWGTGPFMVVDGLGTNDVQTLTISGVPTGGTFVLNYGGVASTPVQWNTTAAQLQTILDGMTSIGPGNTLVSGGPGPGSPLTVTFRNQLGSQLIPLMTVSNNTLTGGTAPAAAVAQTTPGVAGAAAKLLSAIDPHDHLLILMTPVTAPAPADSPQAMP